MINEQYKISDQIQTIVIINKIMFIKILTI
jgi:hypothetical protein